VPKRELEESPPPPPPPATTKTSVVNVDPEVLAKVPELVKV
jgi:hypothetical protein